MIFAILVAFSAGRYLFPKTPSPPSYDPHDVVFECWFAGKGTEFKLGPRTRQWFIETIESVPLRRYDPQAAHEVPSGRFEYGGRTFYLFGMGVWDTANSNRWLWTSSFVQQLLKRLHGATTEKEVRTVLREFEADQSFEFIPNSVQQTEPESYPLQDFTEAFGRAETEEER